MYLPKFSLKWHFDQLDAVRGNEGFETATVNQIKEATKNWLRNASDRGGGRAARQRRDAE